MGSNQFVNHSDRVRSSVSFPSDIRHGRSKAQSCLSKILRIISSIPPDSSSSSSSFSEDGSLLTGKKRGFDIDLNVLFCSSPEIAGLNSPDGDGGLSDSPPRFATEKFPEVCERCHSTEMKGLWDSNSASVEIIIAKTTGAESSLVGNNGDHESAKSEETGEEGSFGLLLEAAKFVIGDFGDGESKPEKANQIHRRGKELDKEISTGNRDAIDVDEPITERSKRDSCLSKSEMSGEEEKPAGGRSKRGRTRMLPHKYRDSVLEPLKPYSRRSRLGPTKRRSR